VAAASALIVFSVNLSGITGIALMVFDKKEIFYEKQSRKTIIKKQHYRKL
jgi:hypothetical protein